MQIQESGEMYLETILILNERIKNVRAIDVAAEMGYSKPSVSRALGILRDNGYITVDGSGFISLTESGSKIAKKIYERHNLLADFFASMGVPYNIAQDDACKIEHVISDETFEAIKKRSER